MLNKSNTSDNLNPNFVLLNKFGVIGDIISHAKFIKGGAVWLDILQLQMNGYIYYTDIKCVFIFLRLYIKCK